MSSCCGGRAVVGERQQFDAGVVLHDPAWYAAAPRPAREGRDGPIESLHPGRARRRIEGVSELEAIGGEIEDAIERVRVPAYVIDGHGIIRWLNPAARKIVGDVRGRHLTSVVAPEETRRAQEIFTRNLFGPPAGSDNKSVVIGADGERVSVELSAVPLQSGGHVIGVFGQVLDIEDNAPPPP